jgi:hypothetical protein
MRAWTFVIAFLGLGASHPSPAASPLPAEARFFMEGLEGPYFSAERFATLVKICVTQYPAQCSDDNAREEDLESVDPAVFAKVSVLGPAPSKPMKFDSWLDFILEVNRTSDDFMSAYLAFEKSLLARIGAVHALCPEADSRHEDLLETIRLVNFSRYWLLARQEYEDTAAEIDAAQARYLAQLRSQWSPAQCTTARGFGFDLIRLFSSKLRSYLTEDWQRQGKGDRTGTGMVNVWYLGMRTEGVLHPEVFADALENGPKIGPAAP